MESAQREMEKAGHVVLSPCDTTGQGLSDGDIALHSMMHAQKILMADEVYIIDGDKDTHILRRYTGEHTDAEIKFAQANGKKITYHVSCTLYHGEEEPDAKGNTSFFKDGDL